MKIFHSILKMPSPNHLIFHKMSTVCLDVEYSVLHLKSGWHGEDFDSVIPKMSTVCLDVHYSVLYLKLDCCEENFDSQNHTKCCQNTIIVS